MKEEFQVFSVDKQSPVPIYHQIASGIRERIIAEILQSGDKLPSENTLAEEYGVSRITLRQALSELERDGIIIKQRGKGVFVHNNPKPLVQEFNLPNLLSRKLHQEGITIEPVILVLEKCKSITSINQELEIEEKEPLVFIKRLFKYNEKPIAVNRSWISASKVPGIVEEGLIHNHLSVTLAERYNLETVKIHNTIEAAHCSASDLKLLEIAYQTPMCIITATSYDKYSSPIEFSKTNWLGDHVKFTFNIDKSL
ncbi:MAG: GntR family transcriptional regulator [Spirochaetia bacterium]|nr:GntR family transcriptional regulator [Spirochaetia bacterium]